MLKRHKSARLVVMLCVCWSITQLAQAQPVRFSMAEKAWLNKHQRLHVGVVELTPPILFFSDKKYPQGLVADYLRALALHLGLQLQISLYPDEQELRLALDKGEVDVIGAEATDYQGRNNLIFSRPYLSLPIALFAREGLALGGLDSMRNKTVVVVKGSVWESDLSFLVPGIKTRVEPNIEQALKMVTGGGAAAFLGDVASTDYLLRRQKVGDLKEQRLDLALDIALATSAHDSVLQSLVQKGLDRIDSEELQEIWQRWPGVETPSEYAPGIPALFFWVPAFLAWTLALAWAVRHLVVRRQTKHIEKLKRSIRRLRRRERRMKAKLLLIKRKALEYRDLSRTQTRRLRLLDDVMPNGAWVWDSQHMQCQWDEAMFSLFRQQPESFVPTPETILKRVHEDDREMVAALYERQAGEGDQRLSYRIHLPEGGVRWLFDYSYYSLGDEEEGDQRVGICWDITECMIAAAGQPVES